MNSNLYVGFSSSAGLLGRVIRYLTGGSVNHAFLLWEDAHLGWVVLGANENGITLDTLTNFRATRTIEATVRPIVGTLWNGLTALRNDLNEKYNLSGLVGMSVVEIARAFGREPHANPLSNRSELFCSQFAVEVIRAAGITLLPQTPSSVVDPQMLMSTLAADRRFMGEDVGACDS